MKIILMVTFGVNLVLTIMRRIYSSNKSILAGIRATDDNVLKHLYKEHYPMIRNLVLTNSGTEDDVQDILQEGIIVFYEKAKDNKFELTCEVKTYLYSVCRNKWLKALRKRNTNVQFSDVYEQTVDVEQQPDEAELSKQQRIISELIHKIGEVCKNILTYFYYEKLSMNEIAERMGYTNADNAKNQKYKCLKRLQKLAIGKYEQEKPLHL